MNGIFVVHGRLGLFPEDPEPLDIVLEILHEDGVLAVTKVISIDSTPLDRLAYLSLADYEPDSGRIKPIDPKIPDHFFHIVAVVPPKQSASTEPATPP